MVDRHNDPSVLPTTVDNTEAYLNTLRRNRFCRYVFRAGFCGGAVFGIPARDTDLLEIPPSTVKLLGMNLPFSGGFYFRALPYWVIRRCGKAVNREGKPNVFYLHPREIDPNQPRLQLNRRDAWIHYYGIKGCEKKLQKTLRDFPVYSVREGIPLAR